MHHTTGRRLVGVSVLLLAAACGPDGSGPTGPKARPVPEPAPLVIYDDGWTGWLSESDAGVPDGAIVPCPVRIDGIGPVLYQNRWWNSTNGPLVTTNRTLTASRYSHVLGLPITFASTDGARAVTQWFLVTCKSFLGIPTFDLASFAPGGWLVTYDPNSGGGGGGGGGDGGCETQLIYDPDQPCPGGGGGGGGEPTVTPGGGGGGGGGGTTCHQEWVIIEVSYDGGATWSTWWEGYANVCE